MRRERSQGKHFRPDGIPGTLFVVGVPIGHPDDLTIRALATFRKVTLIATKNPPATHALLAHHNLEAVLTTYDRDNAVEKVPILLERLEGGSQIALVSDGGMPVIYDPGRLLIAAAFKSGIPIEVIPGTSAILTAASIAGLDGNAFVFEGRWAGDTRSINKRLQSLRSEPRTIIMFPPARAVRKILSLLSQVLGNRRLVAAIDLTKQTQNILRGRALELLANYHFHDESTQVTLVIEGKRPVGRKRQKEGE
ncbi:MAG: putative Methyltransferase [Nitrospira sp.]|jgi:16S rRNA (cytidine1402-2'-O)-methyltransferase|nr:putative Methyltransferase [Nitrospira sp.]